jgi:Arc/MetJ-type ribon-helix-helix transcriptional regulator
MSEKTDEILLSSHLYRRLVAKVDGVRFKSVSDVVREGLVALALRDAAEGRSSTYIPAVPSRSENGQQVPVSDWGRTVFLHTGWTARYDGSEAPEGGHAYLKQAVGVEADNFKPVDGWCYGYAPVSRTSEGREFADIPKANRTLRIEKLGASKNDQEVDHVTVVWTARHPFRGPVIVGLYDDATIYRFMPGLSDCVRPFIAKARVENCHLIPESDRTFGIVQKQKGFPGMAAAWFAGLHADGPAREMLDDIADYIPRIRRYSHRPA